MWTSPPFSPSLLPLLSFLFCPLLSSSPFLSSLPSPLLSFFSLTSKQHTCCSCTTCFTSACVFFRWSSFLGSIFSCAACCVISHLNCTIAIHRSEFKLSSCLL